MCGTCGCSDHHHEHHDHHGHHHHEHDHEHFDHDHDHHDHYEHDESSNQVIQIERDILSRNNTIAERVRGYLEAREILGLNLMSSPGSGKTTLLEKTIACLSRDIPVYVIEGDQQTTNDADRIRELGVPAVQINTGNGCHLEADMVYDALRELNPEAASVLFIENVGNLVCPAIFNLGEHHKVVVISTTEGEDKPLKYPQMFCEASVCIINKCDLLPYLPIQIETLRKNLLKTNPHLKIFEVSALTGAGMDTWCEYIVELLKKVHPVSRQQAFFDEKASQWDCQNHADLKKVEKLLALLQISPTDRILDVGTGTGVLLPYLEKTATKGSILAIDVSPKMLTEARKKFPDTAQIAFQELDIEEENPAGQFDKIILFSVFPHLNKKISTIRRLVEKNLAPEGKLMIAHDRGRVFLNHLHAEKDERLQTARLLDVEQQKMLFENAGLHVADAYEDENTYYLILTK